MKVIESIGNSSIKSREKMIKEPKLPFNLLTKYGAELVGYAMSDGCISRKDSRFTYASNDKKQLERVRYLVNRIFGKVRSRIEREEKNHFVLAFPPTVGRVLEKLGVPKGNKSVINPKLPEWIKSYGSNEYLKAVFTDEANSTLTVIKTQRHKYWSILLPITHGRARDITKTLDDKVLKTLELYVKKGEAIYLGKLPKEVKISIQRIKPPNLLVAEHELLKNLI